MKNEGRRGGEKEGDSESKSDLKTGASINVEMA